MLKDFPFPIGFSDHTEGWEASMLSIGVGSCLLEKHFTLDHKFHGPDHKISSDPLQFKKLVEMIRQSEAMLGSNELTYTTIEEKGRDEFRRSIVAKRDINSGELITKEMLAYKRPGGGLKPYQRSLILGKYSSRRILKNEQIFLSEVQ